MDSIGVRELRQHASRYLDRVKNGESIQVTERGVPVAVLAPVAADEARTRLIEQGRLTPRPGSARQLPQPVLGAASTADTLDDLRADRE